MGTSPYPSDKDIQYSTEALKQISENITGGKIDKQQAIVFKSRLYHIESRLLLLIPNDINEKAMV